MKKTKLVVPWNQGLHARPATKLVQLAKQYRSAIQIRSAERMADAKSILSILLLCASVGTMLEIEVFGADEADAATAIERLFESERDADDAPRDIVSGPEEDLG